MEYLDKLHSGILRKFAQWYPSTSCMLIKIAQWCSPTSCTMIYLYYGTAFIDKLFKSIQRQSSTVVFSDKLHSDIQYLLFTDKYCIARAYKKRKTTNTVVFSDNFAQWYSQKSCTVLGWSETRVIVNFVFAWFLYIRCLIIVAYLRRLFHRFFMVLL